MANGAHYFLYGKLDKGRPNSGVLQESGFGVTFPNYIVDVQGGSGGGEEEDGGAKKKAPYEEAIQFQCLERGGVRVLYFACLFAPPTPCFAHRIDCCVIDVLPFASLVKFTHGSITHPSLAI